MARAVPRNQIAGVKTHARRIATLFALISSAAANAQIAPDGSWHYLAQPYAMFPNMHGKTGIADLPTVPVDEDPGDIFDHLQMGAMLYLEARNDHWAFSSDVLYMDLGSDIESSVGPVDIVGDADVSQIGWELAVLRRITPSFELGVGLTYNQVDVDLDLTTTTILGATDRSGGLEQNWIDPTIVFRATRPLDDDGRWFFQARGNVGGFGVGSDLMWQIMAHVIFRPSEKWSFSFGYRVIDIDFEDGSGPDHFVYDMQTFGPELRLGINF